MFGPEVWGAEIQDVGYLHARAGPAQAFAFGDQSARARDVAQAELADVKRFGAPRALGIALRTAGPAEGGDEGFEPLRSSATNSPALTGAARAAAFVGGAGGGAATGWAPFLRARTAR